MSGVLRAATLQRAAPPGPRWSYRLALLAVFLQLAMPANLLNLMGIDYALPPEGNGLLTKFHPATYVIVLAVLVGAIEWRGRPEGPLRVCARYPGIALLLVMFVLTAAFAILSVGASGTALYIENYISSGLLAIVGMACTPERRRWFGHILVAMCLVSAVIVVPENALQIHLVPYYVDGKLVQDLAGEFRGAALFDHPLTAASVTMMAVFVVMYGWRDTVWKLLALAMLALALIAYGGRTALVMTVVTLTGVLCLQLLRALATGRDAARPLLLLALGGLAAGFAGWILLSYTNIGDRLVNTFYFDDSAEVRNLQWEVLRLMTPREVLFGVPLADQPLLNFLINIEHPFAGIENFWLLAFVSLGVMGFALYLAGLLPFLAFLWRIAPGWGRLLLICVVLVASTSNSLGRKSNLLFLLTTSMLAASASRRVAVLSSPVAAPAPRHLVETHSPA